MVVPGNEFARMFEELCYEVADFEIKQNGQIMKPFSQLRETFVKPRFI